MPELPEVETVIRGMEKAMKGKVLERIEVHVPKLRWALPPALSAVKNQRMVDFSRRAKYGVITLESGDHLILHLGMSGRILFSSKNYIKQKHDHIVFYYDSGNVAVFHDPRRFGMVDIVADKGFADYPLFKTLGVEPLTGCFNCDYLFEALKKTSQPIKVAIMQSKIVVGIGNIYASESLFYAKIDPFKPAKALSKAEVARLVEAIKHVLTEAIASGGSTLKDYVQTDGTLGYFQHKFKVYDRENEPCTVCKTPIKKDIQAQRSTYFCPKCQG